MGLRFNFHGFANRDKGSSHFFVSMACSMAAIFEDFLDCKKHNLDNVAKAAIFKTLDPITFSKIKHLKTAMEIWQGLGKLCEGSEDLRKQKIEVLLEKFKGFKMLPGESFDMLDERFHKILNDLASLNHVLSPKEKNVRLLRSLPTEWYTKATAMEEGRNLENYTVQGLLDELRTYEHELKKKKEEQVTPFPTALMTTPRVPSSEGTCPRSCDTPSSSQPPSSKMENYDEEFAMMVKQFWKFKKKPGHWKSACPYPKVEKYGERERNEKKKKAMVAAESDESSSSSSDEEALVCMERRAERSNHEDRWTMSEDDTLCLMAKDDADQEVTSQTSCSSSYESIPTFENLFDQFKKMMVDFEEINLKHSSLTEENKLLSEENLKLTEGRKSQLNEITQLKTENESLSEKVKSLNKELGILKSKEAVDKLLETTNHKSRKGLGFDPSSSKRKGRTTFIPPKPTAKPNKQKGKEKEKPTEVPKKISSSRGSRLPSPPTASLSFTNIVFIVCRLRSRLCGCRLCRGHHSSSRVYTSLLRSDSPSIRFVYLDQMRVLALFAIKGALYGSLQCYRKSECHVQGMCNANFPLRCWSFSESSLQGMNVFKYS
ncbi:unnamed protein product [Cuscuta campestris]|uniref:Uncharacterized protein n=1 Tax=Cuscuta campestris TaxID=132261 RepID=A0A484MQR1_9ASTE|nr:unnamed protein product [Cuscuta campestris]